MAILVFMLVMLIMGTNLYAADGPDRDLIRRFKEMVRQKEAQGVDASAAQQLNRESIKAAREGRVDDSIRLLQEAKSALEGNGGREISAGMREAFREPNSPASSAFKNFPGGAFDAVSMKSPFGIFGPYQFILDSNEIMTHEKINVYLADLGVKWVQEMPMGINNVPPSINIYSRVGREGGTTPPNVAYDKYKSALRKSIGRLKDRVKYWEVQTEPGGLPPPKGWKGYEKEYAAFLKETYDVIKSECPDCMVVLGGAGGIASGRREDLNAAFVRKILGYGAGEYFDVFSFKMHHYKVADYVDLKNKMEIYDNIFADYKMALKKKTVFLETGIYDGDPNYTPGHPLSFIILPPQTELQQAAGLVKSYVFAIAQGVDRIFWNEVFERHNFGGEKRNPFNYYGLVNNPLNDGKSYKKLAYYAYKKMVEVLEGSDWENIVTVKEQGGVFIYKLNRQGKTIMVAWNDGAGDPVTSITGLKPPKVKVTYAVPDMSSGLDVHDYSTSFKEFVVNTEGNAIKLTLGGKPVYIEEEK